MSKLFNRVKVTTATTGTGTITLGAAATGYQTAASAGVANGDVVSYVIEDSNGNVEFGTGTYTSSGTTLSRTVLQSCISGTWGTDAITLSGTATVFLTALASDLYPVPVANGGTGQSSYTIGDILYASGTTTISKLAGVATGNALISGGTSTAPSWGKVGLTTHVSGTLPVANGGTNASSAGITAFNNITGYTASGATGTTSTNLVFSTSPSITTPTIITSATGPLFIGGTTASSSLTLQSTSGVGTSDSILFKVGNNGGTTAATIDTAGNLGLGVTPSAWLSSYKSMQLGNGAALSGRTNTSSQYYLTANAYVDSGTTWRYISADYANRHYTDTGKYIWDIASSGSAGSAISFTQAMTLTSGGSLLIGTTATPSSSSIRSVVVGPTGDGYYQFGAAGGGGGLIGSSSGAGINFYTYTGAVGSETYSQRAMIDADGNVIVGTAALATSATNGFLYIPTCAGAPTGSATSYTGRSPLVVDSTNNRLYVRVGSTWKYATLN